ncbi:MAG: hypothetical protein GX898_08555 [Corynebacterium sp.]|uniref:type II toxin-antitoxin system PemK/MazF family toxin n=1 Tax=uncultured Corynebacterium sp. TaxID=159447 RepID=UPI0017A16FF1|nr:type II toxin-antitoxin system PemK/MazF family toxin [uncultured Corynebacterium sp.]NLZ58331.1 hypothetical protein [Corynebacterium sp.]
MSSTLARKTEGEGHSRDPKPGAFKRLFRFLTQPQKTKVDESLAIIRDGLGIDEHQTPSDQHDLSRLPGPQGIHAPTEISVSPTESMARPIFYAPDMDGQADPGEVVWIWAPADGVGNPPRERAMVVVGRTRSTILGLLISCNPEHRSDEDWIDIGSGVWDERGRQSWVRLDRILEVSELGTRRQGTVLPRGRFERIANRLNNDFGWA